MLTISAPAIAVATVFMLNDCRMPAVELARVPMVAPAMAPLNPTGAACTALAERRATSAPAPTVIPRCKRHSRSRSTARLTRFCAASSDVPRVCAISRADWCWKYRSSRASRSASLNWPKAGSRSGVSCSQIPSGSLHSNSFIATASISRARRRTSDRTNLAAMFSAVRCSQPESTGRSVNRRACCANAINTFCVTSSPKCGSRTIRSAAE